MEQKKDIIQKQVAAWEVYKKQKLLKNSMIGAIIALFFELLGYSMFGLFGAAVIMLLAVGIFGVILQRTITDMNRLNKLYNLNQPVQQAPMQQQSPQPQAPKPPQTP